MHHQLPTLGLFLMETDFAGGWNECGMKKIGVWEELGFSLEHLIEWIYSLLNQWKSGVPLWAFMGLCLFLETASYSPYCIPLLCEKVRKIGSVYGQDVTVGDSAFFKWQVPFWHSHQCPGYQLNYFKASSDILSPCSSPDTWYSSHSWILSCLCPPTVCLAWGTFFSLLNCYIWLPHLGIYANKMGQD